MSQLPYDPKSITRLLNVALAGSVLGTLVYFGSNYLSFNFLAIAEAGLQSELEIEAAAASHDQQAQISSIIGLLLILVHLVVLMLWIYRTSANAAVLRPEEGRITPGWAVGWFFIPFANLWMPFKALNQVWHSSLRQSNEINAPFPGILTAFMALQIINQFVDRFAGRMIARAEDLEAYRTALTFGNFSGALDLVAILTTFLLAKQISAAQVASTSVPHSDSDMKKDEP